MMSVAAGTVLLAQAPADLSVCYGKGYTLNSTADAPPFGATSYSWYEDGDLLADKNEVSLSIPAGKPLGTYAYWRMAANDDCPEGIASNTFTVTVNPVPAIHTANQTVAQGMAISTIIYTASDGAVISLTGDLPPGVNGDVSGSSFIISGTTSGTGTFGYELISTLDDCTSAVTAGTITVFPPPPDAVSTQIWVFGTQTWSDRIIAKPSNCASTATLSTAESPPAQYKVNGGRSYYNWTCVNAAKTTTLCPSPWRVPTQPDFNTLVSALGGNVQSARDALYSAWGYGGYAHGSSTTSESTNAYYWSSTEHSTVNTSAHLMDYSNANLTVYANGKYHGFQVRCVK
jgi:uncharacterized protein (TIGR02145 family)